MANSKKEEINQNWRMKWSSEYRVYIQNIEYRICIEISSIAQNGNTSILILSHSSFLWLFHSAISSLVWEHHYYAAGITYMLFTLFMQPSHFALHRIALMSSFLSFITITMLTWKLQSNDIQRYTHVCDAISLHYHSEAETLSNYEPHTDTHTSHSHWVIQLFFISECKVIEMPLSQ